MPICLTSRRCLCFTIGGGLTLGQIRSPQTAIGTFGCLWPVEVGARPAADRNGYENKKRLENGESP